MALKSFMAIVITFLLHLYHYNSKHLDSTLLQGTVINKETGRPLENVYLYTVKGEEKALTNNKGQFQFTTWKKLPVTRTVEHNDFEKVQLQILALPKKLLIQLKQPRVIFQTILKQSRGRVERLRSAKPSTTVRIRP